MKQDFPWGSIILSFTLEEGNAASQKSSFMSFTKLTFLEKKVALCNDH